MKFENPQNNAQEQGVEVPDTKDAADFFENASAEEISQVLKQKESSDINKNLAEIAEEQKDLDKRISDLESTLKSPTKNVGDKGATTQEDVSKLQKRKKTLATQGKKMQLKKPLTKYVKEQVDSGFAGSKKELEEIEKELETVNKRIAESQNYESKSEYTAENIATGKDVELIKKRDAMEKDVVRLKAMVVKGEKVEQVRKLMNNEQEDTAKNIEEGGDVQVDVAEKDVEQSDDEKEKADFDKEFQKGWDKKALENKSTEDIQRMVRDLWKKRGELLGSEDNNETVFQENEKKIQIARDVLKDRGAEDSPLALENMTFTSDEKLSRDTDMNEEEKFDKEVASRAQKELESTTLDPENLEDPESLESQEIVDQSERERQSEIDALKNTLDDARRAYTSVHYKSEGMVNKIKAVFGHIDTSQDQDVTQMKGDYQNALESYRAARLEGLDDLSEEQQKEILTELKSFDLNEGISLYEDRVAAKAETMPGKLGEYALNAINQYKKLPTSAKLALSGALLVGGVMSGTGLAAGVFGAATIGKRALGAGLAGVGATGFVEARAQKKESKNIKSSLESFQNLSIEEQKAALLGFDNTSFDKLEKAFHGKIAGRSRRVLVGIGAAAGVMSAGSVLGKAFGVGAAVESVDGHMPESGDIAQEGGEVDLDDVTNGENRFDIATRNFTEDMRGTEAYERFHERYGGAAYARYIENGGDESAWARRMSRIDDMYESFARNELQLNLAREIAKEMGIDDPNRISFTTGSELVPMINGVQISAEDAERMQSVIRGGYPDVAKITFVPGGVSEGVGTDWLESDLGSANSTVAAAEGAGGHMPESGDVADFNEITAAELSNVRVQLTELLYDTEGLSGEMTLNQLNETDNMEARNMMAAIMMRATQEFGTEGIVSNGETVEDYLGRLNDLSNAENGHVPESGDIAEFTAEQANESTVNTELLREEAQKAMGGIKFDTDIPNFEESVESQVETLQEDTPDSGDGTTVDMSAAEAQMDASQLADNPEQVGWSGEGTNIEVNQDGIGTLTIENGGSIEGSLIAFFKENSDRLTDGGMGWDPDKFKDINEWAGKRAHGLVEEYMKAHPGFDLDTVQPGTSFEVDLNNTADIRVGEIDFEGGVHIVPEAEKVEILGSEDGIEAKNAAETNVAETINTKEGIMGAFGMDNDQYEFFQNAPADEYVSQMKTVPVENQTSLDKFLIEVSDREGVDLQGKTVGDILETTEINILEESAVAATSEVVAENIEPSVEVQEVSASASEVLNTKEDIMQAFGMDEERYAYFQEAPAEGYVSEIKSLPANIQTPLDRVLIGIADSGNVDLENKTVGDILETVEINILEPQPLEEQVTEVGSAQPEILNIADERELIGELTKNPEFNKAVAGQMQETYGMPAQNVGRTRMGLLEGNNPVVQKQVEDVIARAKEQLGTAAGAPRDNTTVGTYFTRIFAQAAQKGKVKDIFPSSEFTV